MQKDTTTLEDDAPALVNYVHPCYKDQLHTNNLLDPLSYWDLPTNTQHYKAIKDAMAMDTKINRAHYGILHRVKLN